MLEEITPEQVIQLANIMQEIIFVFLFVMLLYFFAKAIPAFLQYKTIKMVEIKVTQTPPENNKKLTIHELYERYTSWRNKRKEKKDLF